MAGTYIVDFDSLRFTSYHLISELLKKKYSKPTVMTRNLIADTCPNDSNTKEPEIIPTATPTRKRASSEESTHSPKVSRNSWTKHRYLGKSSSPISDMDIMDKKLDINKIFHDNHPWVVLFNEFEAEKAAKAAKQEASKFISIVAYFLFI